MYGGVIIRLGEYMVRLTPLRGLYVSRVMESLGYWLRRHGVDAEIKRMGSWLYIGAEDALKAAELASRVFGVSSAIPVAEAGDLGEAVEAALRLLRKRRAGSFIIRVHGRGRYGSGMLGWMMGSVLHDIYGYRVDALDPDVVIHVLQSGDRLYVGDRVFRGPGGLPYGVEGCLLALVSGGVDSAVAAWMAMKRGARVVPVYMDMGGYWPRAARDRAVRAIELLWEKTPWKKMDAYIVRGIGEIVASAPVENRLRCLFCKANMYRVAGLLSEKLGCYGVVTGEAVGQVASQTLINLSYNTLLSPAPIYRPVGFMDKLEIVELAESLGFGELNRSVGSCMLRPEKPETSMTRRDLEEIRRALQETHDMAVKAVEEAEKITYREEPERVIRQG